MPRNSGGTYNSPIAPFVGGTTIRSEDMNTKFADINQALSESLSNLGQGAMKAPLQLPDGTAAAPALTFNSDQGVGLWRSGTYQVRFTAQAATLFQWGLDYVYCNRPLVVSATNANSNGVTSTGTGTGMGGVFTGGTGTGNAMGADGVLATGGAGAGSGAGGDGLMAVGGASTTSGAGGPGVRAAPGTNSALSYVGVGGGISMTGVPLPTSGITRATNGLIQYTGNNTALGSNFPLWTVVHTNGGNISSFNVRTVNNSGGSIASWADTRWGLTSDVDDVMGAGGQLWITPTTGWVFSGSSTATATNPATAIVLQNGNLQLNGTTPNSNVALLKTLTQGLMPKAWGSVPSATGANNAVLTVSGGQNVGSVKRQDFTLGGVTIHGLLVTFAQPMGSANYVVTPTGLSSFQPGGLGSAFHVEAVNLTTTGFNLYCFAYSINGGGGLVVSEVNLTGGTPAGVSFTVMGIQ